MRTITLIVLHCSATRTTQRYTFRQCREDHRKRGWKDIGYHFYISRDGQVHEGRPLWQEGAHCCGHNKHSVGICYEGGLDATGEPADTRTAAQRHSLRALLERLMGMFPSAIILGHRDILQVPSGHDPEDLSFLKNGHSNPATWTKHCPCFDAVLEYEDLEPARTCLMKNE